MPSGWAPVTLRTAVIRLWWVLIPAFALLVARLVFERGCRAPYELLPDVTSSSLLAWPLAIVYLGVHCWAAAACFATIEQTGTLTPTLAAARAVWGKDWPKLVFAAAVFALEYAPIPLWQMAGRGLGGC